MICDDLSGVIATLNARGPGVLDDPSFFHALVLNLGSINDQVRQLERSAGPMAARPVFLPAAVTRPVPGWLKVVPADVMGAN